MRQNELELCKEVLLKLEDWPALIQLHVKAEAWSHAFMTAKRCPEEEPGLHETHAKWLIAQDRCDFQRVVLQLRLVQRPLEDHTDVARLVQA